uniref:CSON002273 protein n=1 Tax=Culicoides sonorensis TaxID=179676 RepID=A0A336LWI0_CULSO
MTTRTPLKSPKSLKYVSQCPKCIQEDEIFMVECRICLRKFHLSCVNLSSEEERTLKFDCDWCKNELEASNRTMVTRKFTKIQQVNLPVVPKVDAEPQKPPSIKSKSSNKSNIKRKLQVLQEEKKLLDELEKLTLDENESDNDEDLKSYQGSYQAVEQKKVFESKNHQIQEDTSVPLPNQEFPILNTYHLAARQSLSKDLPLFHGYTDEWPIFISSFKRTTEICGFTDDENIIRLEKALKGEARDKVASQLTLPSCVSNILKTLEMIYGRPEHILKSQIKHAQNLPNVRMNEMKTLVNLSVAVDNICATMTASNLTNYYNNPFLVDELIEKLPPDYKISWSKFTSRIPTANMIALQEFLHEEAVHACKTTDLSAEKLTDDHRKFKGRMNVHIEDKNKECIQCNGNCDSLVNCVEFLSLPVSLKWETVKKFKLCRCCLKQHFMRFPFKCREAKTCGLNSCYAKHHRLLHRDAMRANEDHPQEVTPNVPQNNEIPTTQFCGSHLLQLENIHFRYLPVTLTNEKESISIQTFAFLDEGSSGTYMENNLARKLKLTGPRKSLYLKWTNEQFRVESNSMTVNCKISGDFKNATHLNLNNVQTVERLGLPSQNLDYDALKQDFPYLHGLPIMSYSNATPEILIGINNWRCGVPLKVKEGGISQPIATKCRLGWTEKFTCKEISIDESLVFFHENSIPVLEFERFSKYKKLLRSVAYVYRFMENLKCKVMKGEREFGPLSSQELRKAEAAIVRQTQMLIFKKEIHALKNSVPVDSRSVLAQLNPYLDDNNLIRSKSRYHYSKHINDDARNLIVLPRDHSVTNLIISDYHEKYLHQNKETVINQVRQKYHVPKLRQVLNKIIFKCQFCKNQRARPTPPMMSSLPYARIAAFEPAFKYTGVDYFGPISVTVRRNSEKRWGCLFTCLTTRAIHIEVAHKLDTDAFILCFRNFMNRRGPVSDIYCDNGKNFVGAEKVLKEALKQINFEHIANHFTSTNLEWHFNPPISPHMGGAWERLVKSVKKTLYAIQPFHTFSDPLLNSYLIEVEDIINSRPLTYLPLDSEESEALTPNHFIKGQSNVPPLGIKNYDVKFMKQNWQNSQLLKQRFWERWLKEYLPTLNRRSKWCTPTSPLKVGDIVIVIDPNSTRNVWLKGRIVKTYMGKDDQVRSADVQTKQGIFTRPVMNLAKLDIIKPQEERM